jgi:glycosyltransferase involved in cell wall biosynthesis
MCNQYGLRDSVIIAPARPDTPELIAAADIVALRSINEPFGLVIVEAMAVGRPVIGANAGGIPEIIVDGETGLLVPPKSPVALAAKLVLLANDPGCVLGMPSGRGASRPKSHQWRVFADLRDPCLHTRNVKFRVTQLFSGRLSQPAAAVA